MKLLKNINLAATFSRHNENLDRILILGFEIYKARPQGSRMRFSRREKTCESMDGRVWIYKIQMSE